MPRRHAQLPRLGPLVLGLWISIVVLFLAVQSVTVLVPAYQAALVRGEAGARTGLSQDELRTVLQRVLDYSLSRRDDLQFIMPATSLRPGQPAFSQRELDHMVDVRRLFTAGRAMAWSTLLLLAALLLWPTALRRPCAPCACDRHFWSSTLQWSGVWGLLGVAGVGVAAVVDFGQAFDRFHLMFFRNDLWQLPPDSLLILMLPDWQFARLAGLSGLVAAVAFSALIGVGRSLAVRLPASRTAATQRYPIRR